MNALKYSSWNRLKRVSVAGRFDTSLARVKKQRKRLSIVTGRGLMLIPDEIDRGGKLWVKQAQVERFSEETKDLIKK